MFVRDSRNHLRRLGQDCARCADLPTGAVRETLEALIDGQVEVYGTTSIPALVIRGAGWPVREVLSAVHGAAAVAALRAVLATFTLELSGPGLDAQAVASLTAYAASELGWDAMTVQGAAAVAAEIRAMCVTG